MKKSTLFIGCIAATGLFCASAAWAQARPADFGKQWVRSHPLTLGGWYTGDSIHMGDPTLFANAGLNMATDTYMQSQPMHYYMGMLDIAGNEPAINFIKSRYPNRTGWIVWDEPGEQMFEGIGRVVSYLKQNDPDRLAYINVGATVTDPGYDSYLTNMMETVQPDVLCYDNYPFRRDGSRMYSDFYATLMLVRNKAQTYNVPLFATMQSFDWDVYYLPTVTEMRTELFSYLTAGVQGLIYYQYEANHVPLALVSQTGVTSPLYPKVAAANPEALRLGKSLRFLRSTDVKFVPSSTNKPVGLANWSQSAGADTHILSLTAASGSDGLVGFFRDDSNQSYFMLTNLKHGYGMTEADSYATFNVTFDSSINSLLRLSRQTGEPQRVPLSNHVLNLTIMGGTGDLFKYDTGFFAGIPGGDANLDGMVDISDLGILATRWQSVGTWKRGDFNLDGYIDISDLGILATNWQVGTGSAASLSFDEALASVGLSGTLVPEPAGAALLALCASLISLRRRSARIMAAAHAGARKLGRRDI